MFMVRRCSWCADVHGAPMFMVRRCSWCADVHGAAVVSSGLIDDAV
jgi:hypothetical protein